MSSYRNLLWSSCTHLVQGLFLGSPNTMALKTRGRSERGSLNLRWNSLPIFSMVFAGNLNLRLLPVELIVSSGGIGQTWWLHQVCAWVLLTASISSNAISFPGTASHNFLYYVIMFLWGFKCLLFSWRGAEFHQCLDNVATGHRRKWEYLIWFCQWI